MSWLNLRRRLQNRVASPRYQHLDRLLVRALRTRTLPHFRQLKYLGQFLRPLERRVLLGSLVVSALAALTLVGLTIKQHVHTGPRAGGEYTEAVVGRPSYLNPLFSAASDVDSDLVGLIYAGLFTRDNNGNIVPYVAKGYTISPDGKEYTVELRDDIRWSDKEPLTADDVAYTLELIQNPDVGSPLASAFAGVRVDKIDPTHIRFVLPRPFGFFLSALTVGILPEHLWGDIEPNAIKLSKLNLQPIGAGPWEISKLTKDDAGNVQNYVLRHNDYFFNKFPYLDTLNFKFVGDNTEALDALRNQTVLAVSFPPRAATKKLGGKNIGTYTFTLPQYTALFFNPVKEPSLKNSDLRQALALAINKTSLVHDALDDGADAINGPLLSTSPLYFVPTSSVTYDVDAANALLDKTWTRLQPEEYFKLRQKELQHITTTTVATSTASTSTPSASSTAIAPSASTSTVDSAALRQEMVASQTFYRQDKTGYPLMLTITTADTPEYHAVAESLANSWRAIGIKTATRFVPPHLLGREVIKTRDYSVLLYGEILGSDPDLYPFWHSTQSDAPGLNLARYNSSVADQLLTDARTTNDTQKLSDLYKKFQTLLSKDLPAIFLYSPRHIFLASKSLKGVELGMPMLPVDRYTNISAWYLKTHWTWQW